MKNLLIAHNRSCQRLVIKSSLERFGYDVAQAGSCSEALQMASKQTPDALIIDADLDGDGALPMCESVIEAAQETAPLICVLARRIDSKRDAAWRELPGTVMVEMPPSGHALSRQIEQHFGETQDDS
ncbi:MAG: hypothetical protein AAFN78_19220 [Pseudomonadota bacterium]